MLTVKCTFKNPPGIAFVPEQRIKTDDGLVEHLLPEAISNSLKIKNLK